MAIEKNIMNSYLETADIETASDDYATRFTGKVGEFFLKTQLQGVQHCLQNYNNGNILDVGGGHGQLACPLVEDGFDVTVTGSDDCCEKRLKEKLRSGSYTYRTCDMLHLPFRDKSFDIVLAFRLLPHVDRWQQLIGELCRVAKDRVIVDYPDIRSFNMLNNLLFSYKKSIEGNTRPFLLFSHDEIIEPFIEYGFKEIGKKPQFFLPMVLHRKVNSVTFSRSAERLFSLMQITRFLGSPVILNMQREKR